MKPSTYKEIEAMAERAERQTEAMMKRFEKQIEDKLAYMEKKICQDIFRERFDAGEKIEGYDWTYERSYVLRACYASGVTIYPMTKAYIGRGVTSKQIVDNTMDLQISLQPNEVWLTKEEFTTRRLKGQI